MIMDDRARRVLTELVRLNDETKLPATVRELATACGYAGHAGVIRHLDKLVAAGAAVRTANTVRSIRATPKGRKWLKNVAG